jgi:hypothetical protein
MQLKIKQKRLAENLRKEGLSYSEIMKRVPVAKSSLSLWLRDISLSSEQKRRLEKLNTIGQKAGAEARHQQKLRLIEVLKKDVAKEVPKLIQNPFFVLGVSLYWAEGAKQKPWNSSQRFSFGNSDERLIILMRKWLYSFHDISDTQIMYRLHIHETANIDTAKREWAKVLDIEPVQLKVSLKRHNSSSRHFNLKYKGLIVLSVRKSTWLNRRIDLWTNYLADHYK